MKIFSGFLFLCREKNSNLASDPCLHIFMELIKAKDPVKMREWQALYDTCRINGQGITGDVRVF